MKINVNYTPSKTDLELVKIPIPKIGYGYSEAIINVGGRILPF